MGTNSIGLTEWERDFDPVTEQPKPYTFMIGSGCKRPCDFSGYIEVVEPTTGRVTGRLPMCRTCGSVSNVAAQTVETK